MNKNSDSAGNCPFITRIATNLKSWSRMEWTFFWCIIPLILLIIYALPQELKNCCFILSTANPGNYMAYFLHAYTHLELFWHLIGNVIFYLVTLAVIFSFEETKERFRTFCLCAFILVPFITAIISLWFFGSIGHAISTQGFSGICGAFLAYAVFVIVIGINQDGFNEFDHPEQFTGKKKIIYYTLLVLSCIILVLFGVVGILFGQFVQPGGAVVNGLAHFGGFITGLIFLLLYDMKTEKRRTFQMMLAIVVVMVIIRYWNYLEVLI